MNVQIASFFIIISARPATKPTIALSIQAGTGSDVGEEFCTG